VGLIRALYFIQTPTPSYSIQSGLATRLILHDTMFKQFLVEKSSGGKEVGFLSCFP